MLKWKDQQRLNKYKSQLQEMAFPRKKIESEIMSSNWNRLDHLLKVFYFPKDTSVKHWQAEIYTDLADIAKMKWKVNKGYLPKEEYFNNLWSMPFEGNYDVIDKSIDDMSDDYSFPKDWSKTKNLFINNLKEFYAQISIALSENKIDRRLVYSLLEIYFINNKR